MQVSLPKLVAIILVPLILLLLLGGIFLLGNSNKTGGPTTTTAPITAGHRVVVNSSISPYIAKPNKNLDMELSSIGFWAPNALYLRNGTLNRITAKKLIINIQDINGKDSNLSTFNQADTDGSTLISGWQRLDVNGDDNINLYISPKVFNLKNPAGWVDDAFWNVLWQNYIFPKDPTSQLDFITNELKKGPYFQLTK